MKVRVPFFNIGAQLPDEGGSIIVAGPSFTGKTTTVLDILAAKSHLLNYAVAFSHTEKYNHTFSRHIHPNMVHYELTKKTFNRVLEVQKEAFEKDPNMRIAIVLDDVMDSPEFLSWPGIRECFFQSRHIGIFLIVSTQHLMMIPLKYRNSCRFVVFTKQPSQTTRKTYHLQLFGAFENWKDFDLVFKFYTSDYKVLVLLCGNVSYEALHNIAYYKSNNYRNGAYSNDFKIGSESLWTHLDRKGDTKNVMEEKITNSVFHSIY